MLLDIIASLIEKLSVSDMDDKEKHDAASKQDSKFRLPFSPATPGRKTYLESSIFFTPPSSGETSAKNRAPRIPCFPRETEKIPFDLTPEADEFSEEYKFDIIGGLFERSVAQTVFKTLFEYLDDLSLFRASLVSQRWRNIICNVDHVWKDRVAKFISRKRRYCEEKGKENITLQKRSRELAQPILENTPINTPKIFKTNTNFNSQRLRFCPKCNSPARIDGISSSTCDNCDEKFCNKCFRRLDGHNTDSCSDFMKDSFISPKRSKSTKKSIICSKKSKDRLRRLSSQKR